MVAEVVATPFQRTPALTARRWRRSSASSHPTQPAAASPRRGPCGLSPRPARPRSRRGLRRHPARRTGRARTRSSPSSRNQAVRLGRALQQIERGRAALDDPVAGHWPAFGRHGKDRVTLRHVLSHRGGFPTTPATLTPERWGDWETRSGRSQPCRSIRPPGTTSAYHHLTQQWVCAELVRRLDGRDVRRLPAGRDHRAARHDRHLRRLPHRREHRVAKLHATDGTTTRGDWMSARHAAAAASRWCPAPAASPPPATWPASTRRWPRAGARRRAHPPAGDGRADARDRGRRRDRPHLRCAGPPRPRVRAGRSGRSTTALARRDEHHAHLLARRLRLLGLLGRRRPGLAMAFLTNGVRRAEATGFEPAISALTGLHVRPLHHASSTSEHTNRLSLLSTKVRLGSRKR